MQLYLMHMKSIYLATLGVLCALNSALYPLEKIEWCVHALIIRVCKLINIVLLIDAIGMPKLLLIWMDTHGQLAHCIMSVFGSTVWKRSI